ncbi:J domain-containing protein [Nocardioides terrisoli]|uniref:J domain-containing protein n=1 Tax=Nocardioides terrisoli TaxID=3388267 RepID=UPI00287BA0D1|nr:J domain-containing protein [Nocardioides marmorisolisilvae]
MSGPDDESLEARVPDDGPTYYETLGVDREASAGEIRKAWQRRIRKEGPGSPGFGRLNEAAETLLDPKRRLVYDAGLPEPEPEPERLAEPAGAGTPAEAAGTSWRHLVGLGALTALTVAAAAAAGVLTYQHRQDVATESARVQASSAAQQALSAILSYDYRHMAVDEKQALAYLTPSYGKEYAKNFALLTDASGGKPSPVAQTKTVVSATVLGTGVMDAQPDQVHVMAFVNQQTRHRAGPKGQQCSPSCLLTNRVEVTMVKRGGDWLVAGLNPK